VVGVIALALAGCDAPEEPLPEQVRALKAITVTEPASGQIRRFSGVVQATDTATLSFQVAGTVVEMNADIGARVRAGQVLARIDRAPYELNVQAAKAESQRAEAQLKEKELEYERQRKLFEKKWVSQAAFEQAGSAYETAFRNVEYATAKLNIAKRDLAKTELRAPYDGIIATRRVEPFTEVSAGQPVFEINAEGALEVALAIPETVIGRIAVGMPATVTLPTPGHARVEGRVTERGTSAESGNAFPVTVGLNDPPAETRPGMSAEVSFVFDVPGEATAYMIPLSAIAPGEESWQGYVFRYDGATSTVHKVAVRARGVRDNLVVISEGLAAGDIIAVAGVSFLVDGQKVRLMEP